jgi:large subunit ribosomal protein L3
MTHGSKYHRGQGSMGAASDPSKTLKGKHMAGQLGNEQVTVQNLAVVKVEAEDNIIAVKGAVPGPKGGFVFIKSSKKA